MSSFTFKVNNSISYDIKSLAPSNMSRTNKNYLFAFIANHLIYYPTPISLTYAWSFGFLAGMCLLTQMISGIFLAMHYTPHVDLAFSSVEYIMRDVPNGWLLRYVHANGASMFFIVVYSHIFRGLYYGSYMKPRELLWCSGVVLFVLMMATAFTGYVLPWGQMSFWGATVITSMFTVIPFAGKAIVEWLWGGFTVNNPTLNRFFSIHFILPFLIAGVTLIHLALLHKDGSNNPIGSDAGIDDVPFYPYFVSKDMFAFFCFLLFFFTFVFYFPNTLNHPDNCIPADPMETPAHVVPEWYFLPFYAILRSIPNKAGGILAMGGAIAVLFLIPFNNTSDIRNTTYRPIFRVCYWVLMASWIVLTWIGECPVEDIYAFVGQIATVYYYAFFIVLVPVVGKIESALAHYPVKNGSCTEKREQSPKREFLTFGSPLVSQFCGLTSNGRNIRPSIIVRKFHASVIRRMDHPDVDNAILAASSLGMVPLLKASAYAVVRNSTRRSVWYTGMFVGTVGISSALSYYVYKDISMIFAMKSTINQILAGGDQFLLQLSATDLSPFNNQSALTLRKLSHGFLSVNHSELIIKWCIHVNDHNYLGQVLVDIKNGYEFP